MCRGALAQTTGGGPLLDPREAVAVVDCVEQHETEPLADAWDGLQQIQGIGVMMCGDFDDAQCHVAQQLVVVTQGQIDCATLLHGRRGKPLSDTLAVRLRGELRADLGQVSLASGLLEVGSQRRPFAHQMHAAPEESARGPHLGGVHLGLGQHAATPEPSKVMGVDLVVCGLPPWSAFMSRAWPRTQGRPS